MPVKRRVAEEVWCKHCNRRACTAGDEIRDWERHALSAMPAGRPSRIALAGQYYDVVRCGRCGRLNWLKDHVEQEILGTRKHPGPHICPCGCGTLVIPRPKKVRETSRRR